jgi:hypothetical protein
MREAEPTYRRFGLETVRNPVVEVLCRRNGKPIDRECV